MADISAERDGLTDGMPRDERGELAAGWGKTTKPYFHLATRPEGGGQVALQLPVSMESDLYGHRCVDSDLSATGNGPHANLRG